MKKITCYSLFLFVLFLSSNISAGPTAGLSFNGVNQFLTIESHTDFDIQKGEALTISFWVKSSVTGRNQRLVNRRFEADADPVNGKTGYGITLLPAGGDHPYTDWVCKGASQMVNGTSAPYVLNTWFHIAGVYNMQTRQVSLYKDGELLGTAPALGGDAAISSISDIYIGTWRLRPTASITTNEMFAGEMANLRFYKKALSQSEIKADMELTVVTATTPDLIAAYDLMNVEENGSVLSIPDIKGNHPIKMHNYYNIDKSKIKGLTLNGSDQYMKIADHADFNIAENDALSVACWIKSTIGNVNQRVVMKRFVDEPVNGNTGYGITLLNQSRSYADWYYKHIPGGANSGANIAPASSTYEIGEWFHVVASFDTKNKRISLFQDGFMLGQNTILASATSIENVSDVYVGAWKDSVAPTDPNRMLLQYFSGEIANLRFYKKAFTQEDAVADMLSIEEMPSSPELIAAYNLANVTTQSSDVFISDLKGNHKGVLYGYDYLTTTNARNSASEIKVHVSKNKHIIVEVMEEPNINNSKINVFNTTGQLVATQELNQSRVEINHNFVAGLYIVNIGNNSVKVLVK